jgi:hypothetical protein
MVTFKDIELVSDAELKNGLTCLQPHFILQMMLPLLGSEPVPYSDSA